MGQVFVFSISLFGDTTLCLSKGTLIVSLKKGCGVVTKLGEYIHGWWLDVYAYHLALSVFLRRKPSQTYMGEKMNTNKYIILYTYSHFCYILNIHINLAQKMKPHNY